MEQDITQKYVDREGSGINKRRLYILNNNGNYMDVKMEPIDENITVSGTPINADLFNSWSKTLTTMQQRLAEIAQQVECLTVQPDYSEADNYGEARVELADGRLKFSNLKGQPGDNYALTDIGGKYVFYIKDDNLCIDYIDVQEPPFEIENGNLVINFEESNQ